jgi:small subunit ribosomal protein S13
MMVYIFETELSGNKSIVFALTNIYGLGLSTSKIITKKLGFLPNLKTKNLTKNQILLLVEVINSFNLKLAGDLKKTKILNIKRLISIKSYRGLRMFQGLPVRGQRTHSNARTSKKFKRQ